MPFKIEGVKRICSTDDKIFIYFFIIERNILWYDTTVLQLLLQGHGIFDQGEISSQLLKWKFVYSQITFENPVNHPKADDFVYHVLLLHKFNTVNFWSIIGIDTVSSVMHWITAEILNCQPFRPVRYEWKVWFCQGAN